MCYGTIAKTKNNNSSIMELETLVKQLAERLPKDDYPVLNSRKHFLIWLEYVLDESVSSMRGLFARLRQSESAPDMSTFSKANSKRNTEQIKNIFKYVNGLVGRKRKSGKHELVPFDSTTITLTTKLMWAEGYQQVKLFSGQGLETGNVRNELVVFGREHDYKYGKKLVGELEEDKVAVMDRGFAGVDFINYCQENDKKFVVRIKNDWRLEFSKDNSYLCWHNKKLESYCKVVAFCDLETRKEFRLATNLVDNDLGEVTAEDIGEIYRNRWQIELLWKFLKMHLKLDNLIAKSCHGIETQIYMCLIGYLILQLVEIPKIFGNKLLDKLRFLQACMCKKTSYYHWFEELGFF
jgi:putative transposase